MGKAFSRWNWAPSCWLQPSLLLRLPLMCLPPPAAKGWETNLWATGNSTGKTQRANFRLCLEIFAVFPAAARNQEVGGKKPKQEFTQPLQCRSLFHPQESSIQAVKLEEATRCRGNVDSLHLQLSPLPRSEAFMTSFLTCPISPCALSQPNPLLNHWVYPDFKHHRAGDCLTPFTILTPGSLTEFLLPL